LIDANGDGKLFAVEASGGSRVAKIQAPDLTIAIRASEGTPLLIQPHPRAR
jgi:hypothetical protein